MNNFNKSIGAIVIILLFVAHISCKKDTASPTIDDLFFHFQLLDTNGIVTTNYEESNDFIFQTIIANLSDDTITYYYGPINCISLRYKVYQGNSLIGHPHPDNWACTYDIRAFQLSPYEVLNVSINWLQRPENSTLPTGKYTAKHYFSISFLGGKDSYRIELEKEFIVN